MPTQKQYWMFSRPQRKLYRLPQTVAALHEVAHREPWSASRDLHIAFEEVLEREGIKRVGDRRDATGSGGRTHAALVRSLGLAFLRDSGGGLELTLAGEALAMGAPPREILAHQVLRFQYPSPYSVGSQVNIDRAFKVRPILLLLRLLLDPRVDFLTQDEIATTIIVHGRSENEAAYEELVAELLFRRGLAEDFSGEEYRAQWGITYASARDIANTALNWLEITGLIERVRSHVSVDPTRRTEALAVLEQHLAAPLIALTSPEEVFQRKYGLPPGKQKDTRSLRADKALSFEEQAERRIRTAVLSLARTRLLTKVVDPALVVDLATITGFEQAIVARILPRILGDEFGLDQFLLAYTGMLSDKSPDAGKRFEHATAEILRTVFGLSAELVGSNGREPDIVVESSLNWRAIIDTKAYGGEYSLPSSHERAMREYVENYTAGTAPVDSWAFICGAVKPGVSGKVQNLAQRVDVPGTVIGITAWLHLIHLARDGDLAPTHLEEMFSVDRELTLELIEKIRQGG